MKTHLFTTAFCSFLFLLSIGTTAQQTKAGAEPQESFVNFIVEDHLRQGISETDGYSVEGSPWLNEEWQEGYFIKTNDERSGNFPIRYNIDRQMVAFQYQGRELLLNPSTVKGFVLPGEGSPQPRVFRNGFISKEHDISKKLFLEVLHEGKISLLKHHRAKLLKAISPDYSTGEYTDKFIPDNTYYMVLGDGSMREIKLKRKHILRALPGNTRSLKSYARDHDLSFKDEQDVVELLGYYEEAGVR